VQVKQFSLQKLFLKLWFSLRSRKSWYDCNMKTKCCSWQLNQCASDDEKSSAVQTLWDESIQKANPAAHGKYINKSKTLVTEKRKFRKVEVWGYVSAWLIFKDSFALHKVRRRGQFHSQKNGDYP
jgi:hypothetical protein